MLNNNFKFKILLLLLWHQKQISLTNLEISEPTCSCTLLIGRGFKLHVLLQKHLSQLIQSIFNYTRQNY